MASSPPISHAVLTGSAHAFPRAALQDDLWTGFFREHYKDSAIARRLFRSAGVESRHAVANPVVDDVSGWSTEARMERYLPEAMPLAKKAVADALAAARLDPVDVGLFAVASCTGYVTPGLDILVAGDVGMPDSVQRLFIGHMGCYAALPALGVVSDFAIARQRPAVLLCIELASLHLQPPTSDVEQMVAHALFSDAAAAVVIEPTMSGNPETPRTQSTLPSLQVIDVVARTDVAAAELMTWCITDMGFRMGLSQRVPDALATQLHPAVRELLGRHDLGIDDVGGWAAHPGGPRILDVVGEQLGLEPDALSESRSVLAEHGNSSSATVLVVLDEIRKRRSLQPGAHVVALAFGPGLTLYAVLLRVA